MAADPLDTNRLAYSGGAPAPSTLGELSRRGGIWYFAEYQLRGMRAYAWSILVFAIGQPLLYMVAMGIGLGTLVASGVGTVDGVSYLTFVAPAILISTIVMSASGEMTFPVMAGFKWHRTYYAALATPVSPAQIALGHALAVMIRFVVQSAIFWVLMLAFGAAPSRWSILVIPTAVLTSAAFGTLMQAYASTITTDGGQFAFINRFIVMPMYLFAGTFFPLDVMPVYLRWIGWISPIWHGTQLTRVASYGASEPGWLIAVHIGYLGTLTTIGLTLAVRQYRRRLGD